MVKSPPAKAGDAGSVPGSGTSPREGNGIMKKLPAMPETWVQSLGQEDPLKEERATHSSILAWRSPWTEKPGGLQSMGSQRVGHDSATNNMYR